MVTGRTSAAPVKIADEVETADHLEGVTARGSRPTLGAADDGAGGFRKGAVVVWATIGVVWVAFTVSGWIRWIVSDNFTPMEKGPDQIPVASRAFVYGYQVIAMGTLLFMCYRFIIRPLRREGRLSLDGMLLIAGSFAYFLDPLINYFHPDTFGWNAYAVNVGAWGNVYPWAQPNHHYGEALLWAWPDYIDFGLLGAIMGCGVLRLLKRRSPRMTTPAALAIYWVIFFVGATIVEIIRVRLELYSYARTISDLTLWPGHAYQWPIYESVFTASAVVTFTYLRWSWLTRGRSFLDAGLAERAWSARTKRRVLLLAVIGFVPVVWATFYFVPWAFTSMFADSVAQLPSYMTPVK